MSVPPSSQTSNVVNSPRKKLKLKVEVEEVRNAPQRANLTDAEFVGLYPDQYNVRPDCSRNIEVNSVPTLTWYLRVVTVCRCAWLRTSTVQRWSVWN